MRSEARRPPWHGRLWIGAGLGVYLGPTFRTRIHAHYALQLSVGLAGTFRLRAGRDEPWQVCAGAALSTGCLHEWDGEGALCAMIYLDPQGEWGRALGAWMGTAACLELPAHVVAEARLAWAPRLQDLGGETDLGIRARELMARTVGAAHPAGPPRDGRAARALALVEASLGQRPRLTEVARGLFLSPSRLSHLVVEETGLPFRRHVLWARLRGALDRIARGDSLTVAAHHAGFADSAHLTRTFREMFGITPSDLVVERES